MTNTTKPNTAGVVTAGIDMLIPAYKLMHPTEMGRGYGRPIKPTQLNRVSGERFKWESFGRAVVSYIDDDHYVVLDANHRVLAAKNKFGGDVEIPCVVLVLTGEPEEAEIFLDLNKHRTAVNPLELFAADIAAGDPQAISLRTALQLKRLRVATHTGPPSKRTIRSVVQLRMMHRVDSYLMNRMLDLLIKGWDIDEPDTFRSANLRGLWSFLRRYPQADNNRIVTVMGNILPRKLADLAESLGRMDFGTRTEVVWAETFLKEYNKRRPAKNKIKSIGVLSD